MCRGRQLLKTYATSNVEDDLQEAIKCFRKAASTNVQRAECDWTALAALANALKIRFDRVGEWTDLDQVIIALDQVIEVIPTNHPERETHVESLKKARSIRSEHDRRLAEVAEAALQQSATPEQTVSPHLPSSINPSGSSGGLSPQSQSAGDRINLENTTVNEENATSIQSTSPDPHHRPAPIPSPPEHDGTGVNAGRVPSSRPIQPFSSYHFATTSLARFQEKSDPKDLDNAISNYDKVLGGRPPGDPRRSSSLWDLANVLVIRLERIPMQQSLYASQYLNRSSD